MTAGAGSRRSPLRAGVKAGDEAFLFFFAFPDDDCGFTFVEDDDVVVNGEGDFFLPAFFKTAGEGGRADDESREMEESTRAASADTVSPGVVPTQSL